MPNLVESTPNVRVKCRGFFFDGSGCSRILRSPSHSGSEARLRLALRDLGLNRPRLRCRTPGGAGGRSKSNITVLIAGRVPGIHPGAAALIATRISCQLSNEHFQGLLAALPRLLCWGILSCHYKPGLRS